MKIKKIIAGIMALTMCVGFIGNPAFSENFNTVSVNAEEETEEKILDNGLKYILYNDHAKITDCSDKSIEKIEIPAEIEGLPVTNIGDGAFENCENLTEIIIPDSITCIGGWAFDGTKWLEDRKKENPQVIVNGILVDGTACTGSIEISENVSSIGGFAFYACNGITEVTIPDSVTSIEYCAFAHCWNLTKVTIPDSITSIEYCAFTDCKVLTEITIPYSVTSIDMEAFSDCKSLTEIVIPDSVKNIGGWAFMNCEGLTKITISNSITNIGEYTFSNCTNLTEITIPNSVTTIEAYAFSDCENLKEITIPKSVTSIDDKALGYYYSHEIGEELKVDGFKIYSYAGTAAEEYAKENGFEFIELSSENTAKRGDVNGDGEVNARDALAILQDVTKTSPLTGSQRAAADLDGDGEITAGDALKVLQIVVGIDS